MAKTIMIVDDCASIRTVVGVALRGEGYVVRVKPFKPEPMRCAVQPLCLP